MFPWEKEQAQEAKAQSHGTGDTPHVCDDDPKTDDCEQPRDVPASATEEPKPETEDPYAVGRRHAIADVMAVMADWQGRAKVMTRFRGTFDELVAKLYERIANMP